jgi:hypothetical protein
MRALLQELLADLDIPVVHVIDDRDNAVSIGDDLASSSAASSGRPGQPARSPPNPPTTTPTARLADRIKRTAPPRTEQDAPASSSSLRRRLRISKGSVNIFYRPEDVLFGMPGPNAGAALTAPIELILLTRPRARISLASDPAITALMLRGDLERLHVGCAGLATGAPGCLLARPLPSCASSWHGPWTYSWPRSSWRHRRPG